MASERPVRIDLGYHGYGFSGSQRQSGVRTVQEELESALKQVTRRRTTLALAGRTDSGVHAVGQVASGTVNWDGELERLRYALDSVTGQDLVVYGVSDTDPTFHARFSAVRREYRYRVFVSDRAPVLLQGLVWWLRGTVALNQLNEASATLVGTHDFRSFSGRGTGSGDAVVETQRAVEMAEWKHLSPQIEPRGDLYEFRVRANAFLPHMVRNIVGAIVACEQERHGSARIAQILEQRDRTIAPPPAPPEGLTLWSVEYDEARNSQEPGTRAGREQE